MGVGRQAGVILGDSGRVVGVVVLQFFASEHVSKINRARVEATANRSFSRRVSALVLE